MISEKIGEFFKKNKNMQILYIILIIGIAILFFANSMFSKGGTKKSPDKNFASVTIPTDALQGELENILSQIGGAGKVSVMITYEGTGEKYYAADVTSENSSSANTPSEQNSRTQTQTKQSTKLVTPSNEPVITKENFPKVMGVIVVCDGGGDTQVRANITNAVKSALNVADHKISVFAKK